MLLETIYSNMRKIIIGSTIKFNAEAAKNETLETTRRADRYITALSAEDTWRSYPSFDPRAFYNIGIFDEILVAKYIEDKELVPPDVRGRLLEEQRRITISDYVEENNYYRSLAGLPDIGDTPLFASVEVSELTGVDSLTPIHELQSEDLIKLDRQGYLDTLIAQYPKKPYLRYLMRPIPFVTSRRAVAFGLIQTPVDLPLSFYEMFVDTYEKARSYFMSVIYNKNYSGRFDLYDNYIGLMIMTMTVQRMFADTFRSGIENDFYDIDTIQLFFKSYNVPFIEELPLEYQRVLIRNMNNLLYYKSTDKVLYDICSLLGYERINIYKYYLMKEHRLDENEKPIFLYKEVEQEDGSKIMVEDSEKMFELYFQSVELRERNTALHLTNSTQQVEYNQVVRDDIFWWDDDDELKKEIYQSEFNFVESKYLSMNIMYKMTEMLFEIIYTFRIMLDKKDATSKLTFTLPRVFPQKDLNLFTTTVFLCALISKKNKMAGNILASPSKIMSVMGFNFQADFAAIRMEIRNNPKIYDQEVLKYFLYLDVYSVADINSLFANIRSLETFLAEKIATTSNLESYHAYKKLYDTLMVSQTTDIIFKKSNGEIASTFLDYLDDADLALAEYVRNVDPEDVSETITMIIDRLTVLLKDLQHLYIVNDSNNVVITAITKLIRFFKSYTTDLTSLNVMYLMDSKYFNSVRTLDHLESLQIKMSPQYRGKLVAYQPNLRIRIQRNSDKRLRYNRAHRVVHTKTTDSRLTHKRQLLGTIRPLKNFALQYRRRLLGRIGVSTNHRLPESYRLRPQMKATSSARMVDTKRITTTRQERQNDLVMVEDRTLQASRQGSSKSLLTHSLEITRNTVE